MAESASARAPPCGICCRLPHKGEDSAVVGTVASERAEREPRGRWRNLELEWSGLGFGLD